MEPERILVVDDEEPIREIISAMLTSGGFACQRAGSGMEALSILGSGQDFALMVSDLMMAEMDGIGLLERTKKIYPDMPVIMVTAVHDVSVALVALRNGAYDYLLKPFEREQLLATVRRGLENRRLKLANREYQNNLEGLVAAKTEQLILAQRELKTSNNMLVEALGDALDMRDNETEGHSKRVTGFTMLMAAEMGLSLEQRSIIQNAAFLHDMGKINISDAILFKPGKLSPEETTVMRGHCYASYELLRKIPFLQDAAEIVYAHHEWWDGSGYPRGLKGEQIPIGARIFSIADTLDAIRSDRPYRPAQSFAKAREEIVRCSGRQFDPKVVEVFLSISEREWEDLRHDINQKAHQFSQMRKVAKG